MARHGTSVLLLLFLLSSLSCTESTEDSTGPYVTVAEWRQLVGDDGDLAGSGFGRPTNIGTRGIAAYDEGDTGTVLYMGTENLNKFALFGGGISAGNPLPLPVPNPFTGRARSDAAWFQWPSFGELFGRLLSPFLHIRALVSDGCEVWKYTHASNELVPLIADRPGALLGPGFGDPKNWAAAFIKRFKGALYVGTINSPRKGCEIWAFDGQAWSKVVGDGAPFMQREGFGDPNNIGAWTVQAFGGQLYVGTMNWVTGCEVWRSSDGVRWEQVVSNGFQSFGAGSQAHNVYAWSMEVYQDALYVGTFNLAGVFAVSGSQLWMSPDGEDWQKVELPGGDGFGEPLNYGIRGLKTFHDELYVVTAANIFQVVEGEALEVWKYSGSEDVWTKLIGDGGGQIDDGFGDPWNKYGWSMTTTADKLWIGTANTQFAGRTRGCAVWCYDRAGWTQIVGGETGERSDGFGDTHNLGARSMIEYPPGSGTLVVGTYNVQDLLKPEKGCEIWMREMVRVPLP